MLLILFPAFAESLFIILIGYFLFLLPPPNKARNLILLYIIFNFLVLPISPFLSAIFSPISFITAIVALCNIKSYRKYKKISSLIVEPGLNNTENNIKKPSMVIVKITGIMYIIPGIITGLVLAYLAFSYFTTPESQRSLDGYSIPYVMAAVIICIFYIYIGCELILSRKPKLIKRLLAISIPMNILCIIFFLPFAMIPIFEIFLSAITTYKVDLYQKYQDKTANLSQTSNQNINKLSNNT